MAEKTKVYECCTLFRPDLEPEVLDSEVEAVTKLIQDAGGEIERVDRWNKRLLAYQIKDHTEGFYVIFRWFSGKEVLPGLEYHLKYSELCLRHMVIDYTEKERKRRKRLGKNEATKV